MTSEEAIRWSLVGINQTGQVLLLYAGYNVDISLVENLDHSFLSFPFKYSYFSTEKLVGKFGNSH